MPFDIFQPDTGLKDDYDGTIESALFVQQDSGAYAAQLVVAADDGEEAIIKLGVGKNWSSFDGGETISGATTTTRFNNRTAYSRFLTAAMNSGAGDDLRERSEKLYSGLGPCHANFWVGLRFHFDVFIDRDAQRFNEETKKWEKDPDGRPYVSPTKYLGTGSTHTATAPTLMDAADLELVRGLAETSDDYQSFCQAVIGAQDSTGNPMAKNKTVMAKLADQGWYAELKG